MAAEFTDPEGRTWHPRLTFGIVRKIKERTGVDLLRLNAIDTAKDAYALLDMIYYSVEEEAKEREVKREQWRSMFEAGPLMPPLLAFKQAQDRFMYGDKKPEDEEETDADPTPS